MKQLTIRQAINTLKRHRTIKAVYWNDDNCGCMFTQICHRRKLIRPNQCIGIQGYACYTCGTNLVVVPFHDEFWGVSLERTRPERWEMTRAQAIERLEAMLKRPR